MLTQILIVPSKAVDSSCPELNISTFFTQLVWPWKVLRHLLEERRSNIFSVESSLPVTFKLYMPLGETLSVRMLIKISKAEVKKAYQVPLWYESDTVQNQNRQGAKRWRRRNKLEGNMKNLSISWCVGACFALLVQEQKFCHNVIYYSNLQTCVYMHVHVWCKERERRAGTLPRWCSCHGHL